VTDPDIDDTELETLESDLATIETAMDRVDSGDLDSAEAVMANLADDPVDDRAENPIDDSADESE
jgi:predicted negative regulator of RcsB-dependent stress response